MESDVLPRSVDFFAFWRVINLPVVVALMQRNESYSRELSFQLSPHSHFVSFYKFGSMPAQLYY